MENCNECGYNAKGVLMCNKCDNNYSITPSFTACTQCKSAQFETLDIKNNKICLECGAYAGLGVNSCEIDNNGELVAFGCVDSANTVLVDGQCKCSDP